jgi:hypothetical protein
MSEFQIKCRGCAHSVDGDKDLLISLLQKLNIDVGSATGLNIRDLVLNRSRLSCSSCGKRGPSIISKAPLNEASRAISDEANLCVACGIEIETKRIEVLPDTVYCKVCSELSGGGGKARVESEPLGSREDFRRDRASWQKSN